MPPLPFLESRRATLATAVLSLALGWTVHRYVTVVHEAGPWALLCLFAGVFSLLQVAIALLRRPQTWPAWAAALLAAATLAAGAVGTTDARRKTDELVAFVDRAFAGEQRDNEEAEIQTRYARYVGYASGRTCALLGLGLGLPALALSLLCLERARRGVSSGQATDQQEKEPQAESKAVAQGLSPSAWMALSGLLGAAALAAAAIAATRPVPWAEHPEVAEAALLERRFASGDLEGACHLLEPALQTTSEAAEKAIAKRVSDVPGKASRCVDREIQRARKQGAAGCAALVSVLSPMRFVQVAGKQELLESACEGLE